MAPQPPPDRPRCHLGHVHGPSPDRKGQGVAVWICEYPYRTMRLAGPTPECEGCPVWEELSHARLLSDHAVEAQNKEIRALEHLLGR